MFFVSLLIPGVQVGSKVDVDKTTDEINDVFSVVRPVIPDSGCLWCAKLIDRTRLTEESLAEEDRKRQQYIEEIPAPSVVTLNGIGASHAANEFLFSWTGLRLSTSEERVSVLPPSRTKNNDGEIFTYGGLPGVWRRNEKPTCTR